MEDLRFGANAFRCENIFNISFFWFYLILHKYVFPVTVNFNNMSLPPPCVGQVAQQNSCFMHLPLSKDLLLRHILSMGNKVARVRKNEERMGRPRAIGY